MSYALTVLCHDWQRYFAGVLAVAFSVVLVITQFGLLRGAFSLTSVPIDHASADLWLGARGVVSVDVGKPIPTYYLSRLQIQPEVEKTEPLLIAFRYWARPDGGTELCIIVGARLEPESLGAIRELTPELRHALGEPGAIVVDEGELHRLGIHGIGDSAELNQRRVRVVGLTRGLLSLQGPYVFCSLDTAATILGMPEDQTIYILGRCRQGADAQRVRDRFRDHPQMFVMTRDEFSLQSQLHWLTRTRAGIALGAAAVLGLLVGGVVTRQTLYAAIASSIREYAMLQALGIPRWRLRRHVLTISFWLAIVGVLLSLPVVLILMQLAGQLRVPLLIDGSLVAAAALLNLLVAVLSGLGALNSLRQAEPALLLR